MSTERNPLAWGNLEPNRLWSLWEMIELNAPKLHHLLSLTISTELSLTYSRWQNSSGGVTFDLLGATHGDSYAEYDMQISILEELGFLASAAALKRAKVCMQEMSDPTKSYAQNQDRLERLFTDFRHRLFDELKAPHFLVLLPAERSLFQPEAPLFGQSVHDAFPSSRNDIEDAGKCMALEQNTAAVLLLMRALEPALISLQTEVGASVPKDQWHQMINQIESAIEQMRVDLHSQ